MTRDTSASPPRGALASTIATLVLSAALAAWQQARLSALDARLARIDATTALVTPGATRVVHDLRRDAATARAAAAIGRNARRQAQALEVLRGLAAPYPWSTGCPFSEPGCRLRACPRGIDLALTGADSRRALTRPSSVTVHHEVMS